MNPVRRSWTWPGLAAAPGRACHAALLRLPAEVEPDLVAERLAAVAALAGPEWRAVRLWRHRVAARADGDVADRLRAAETGRALDLSGGGPPVRVALLLLDDAADLVATAHRSALDRRSLEMLLGWLRDGPPAALAPAVPGEDAAVPAAGPPPSAGGGGWPRRAPGDLARTGPAATHRFELALPAGTGGRGLRTLLVGALGLVVARYGGVDRALVGSSHDVRASPAAFGCLEGRTVASVPAAATAGELLCAAGAVAWDHGEPPVAAAGVLLGRDAADGVRHVPWLRPPWPLTIGVTARGGVLSARVDHDLDRLSAADARAFARHVAHVARELATAAEDAPADRVELLDAAERRRVAALGEPRRTPVPQAGGATIHAAFEAVARRRPDAVALTAGGTSITYRDLDARAGRLAAGLRRAGIGTERRVGLCVERTPELVALMLATLKAGGAYVPLDPASPPERLAYLVADAGVDLVVSDRDPGPAAGETRCVRPEALLAEGAEPAGPGPAGPDAAAYVIYTSGSTGRPKGVVVPHRNVISLLAGARATLPMGPSDTWTLFHSAAFDFSVWEIWGCLLTGGRLVVVDYWTTRSPAELHDLLGAEGVTVLNLTPTALAQLIEHDRRAPEPLAVRLLVLGGESLDARMLLPWFDRYPEHRCRVVNMYGITETTVHVTAQTVTRGMALSGSRSVGGALPGWRVRVLDALGRPVPPGIAGELAVGGAGVARGYLDRPALTAARFVPDPCGEGRLYRTGDAGRLLPDGRLEHLGRLDDQVKVRGHRVELGEIRAVLLQDPAVQAAAVVLGQGPGGDAAGARLDAYVVLSPGAGAAGVRERAARLLPDYMVPATISPVAALPLTANGKLDRAALPAPSEPRPERAEPAPDGVAGAVEAAWQEVLGAAPPPGGNFFQVGGNSLLAARLAAALRERGLPRVSLRELYLNATVAGLARLLTR